jgi:hypothetical protein
LFFIIKAPVKGNLLIFCVVFGFSAKKAAHLRFLYGGFAQNLPVNARFLHRAKRRKSGNIFIQS